MTGIFTRRDAILDDLRRRVAENDPYPKGVTAADLAARIAKLEERSKETP